LRVAPGAQELGERAAGVQRERAAPVGIRGCGHGGHDPRPLALHEGGEAAKVRRREPDVGAGVAEGALDRAEEARQVVDAGMGEQLGAHGQQGSVHPQLLPVAALAQGAEQRRRLARAERQAQRVGRTQSGGGVWRRQLLGHGATLVGSA
jgi:hypothetical protein